MCATCARGPGGAVRGDERAVEGGRDAQAGRQAGLEHLALLLRHAAQDAQRPPRHLPAGGTVRETVSPSTQEAGSA